jgi:hypothetical protein
MKNLEYYLYMPFPKVVHKDGYLSLVQYHVSGGLISREDIDSIRQYPDVTEVAISGLTQDTFDYFVEHYGKQLKAISFWKCPRVPDLRKLEWLDQLEYVVFFWNQRTEALWDLSKNRSLKGLSFDDFTRMHDISQIALSPCLEELQFGDVIWSKYILNTLEPLEACQSLKNLAFSAKKILDNRIEPLAALKGLGRLRFPANQFSTEQVAWLKAHLPSTVESEQLQPYVKYDHPIPMGGKNKDILIVGKGKPWLDPVQDRKRMERYVEQFNSMYRWFLENPSAAPDDYDAAS